MKVAKAVINLLYPPACLLCQAPLPSSGLAPHREETICPGCVGRRSRSGPPVCVRCGIDLLGAFDAVMECGSCRTLRPSFDMARAPWLYTGAIQQAIRQFKYHRRWRIGRGLANDMAGTARASFPLHEVAAVLPVPLHWLKRRLNGFDAAEHLAETLAHDLEKPYLPTALRRRRWTATQTRLHGQARLRNVHQAFAAQERFVRHRTVLLIDDVLTSGATAHACAAALKRAGALRVYVLAAARTPRS